MSLQAGRVIVELAKYGQDAHDLRLRREGGTRTYSLGTVQPGEVADLAATLKAGRYRLWRSLADHRRPRHAGRARRQALNRRHSCLYSRGALLPIGTARSGLLR